MNTITEIAPDVYRISIFVEQYNLQFNHFLVKDEEPLLYHTGMRQMFPILQEEVSKLIKPKDIKHISFSHFEVDECGAINEWLTVAPHSQAVCSQVGAMVNLSDFAIRAPKGLGPEETLATGKYKFRYIATPHLPHGWDAGSLFEETQQTLFCSDLFHQEGAVDPLTESDILGRVKTTLVNYQAGPLMDYLPFTPRTEKQLLKLSALKPKTLATMHGSSFRGNGEQALKDLGIVLKEVFGQE